MIVYFWKDFNESYKMRVLIDKIRNEYIMIKTQFLFKITLAMLFVYLCNSCNDTIYENCVKLFTKLHPLALSHKLSFYYNIFSRKKLGDF